GELDRDLLHHPERNASFLIGQPVDLGNCSDILSDGDVLKVGNLVITVHHTPGHTMGSVTFAIENALFTGDTHFKGGIGRCDLYGGDPSQMRQSLLKITAMDPLLRVYPGHGVSTTLDRELSCNPYLSF
ncbi:MAG: MBL fold metallo-hydrolase, partial [Clostridia bacterium]|nr:MBL fold metallo-hydrolase [Clostridia bacterium]